MILTLNEAVRKQESGRKVQSFGKQWKAGDRLQVGYPIMYNEETGKWNIIVTAQWGYNISKEFPLKSFFYRTASEIDEAGRPVVPDLAYKAAPVLRTLFKAEFEAAVAKIQGQTDLQASERKLMLQEVYKKYDWDAQEGRIKAQEPISRLRYSIATEVAVVPVKKDSKTGNLVHEVDKLTIASQGISPSRTTKLTSVLEEVSDSLQPEDKFLWVQYNFGNSDDKKTAGKVDPIPVTREATIEAALKEMEPKVAITVNSILSGVSRDSDVMTNRNYSFLKTDEVDMQRAINQYFVLKARNLDEVREDSECREEMKRYIKNIIDLGLETSASYINELVDEYKKENEDKLDKAPTLEELSEYKKDVDKALKDDDDDGADNELAAAMNGLGA